jgi:hypothetical protein
MAPASSYARLMVAPTRWSPAYTFSAPTGCSGDRGNRRAGTGLRGGPNQDQTNFRTLDRPIPE